MLQLAIGLLRAADDPDMLGGAPMVEEHLDESLVMLRRVMCWGMDVVDHPLLQGAAAVRPLAATDSVARAMPYSAAVR